MSFKEIKVQALEQVDCAAQLRRVYQELGGDSERLLGELLSGRGASALALQCEFACAVKSLPSEQAADEGKVFVLSQCVLIGLDRKALLQSAGPAGRPKSVGGLGAAAAGEGTGARTGIVDNATQQVVFAIATGGAGGAGAPSSAQSGLSRASRASRAGVSSLARSVVSAASAASATLGARSSTRAAQLLLSHWLDLRRLRLRCEEGSSSLQLRYMLRSKPQASQEARVATRLAVIELEFPSPDECEAFRTAVQRSIAALEQGAARAAAGRSVVAASSGASLSAIKGLALGGRREWSSKLAHTGRRRVNVDPLREARDAPRAFEPVALGAKPPHPPAEQSAPQPASSSSSSDNNSRSSSSGGGGARHASDAAQVPGSYAARRASHAAAALNAVSPGALDTSKMSPSQKRAQELLTKMAAAAAQQKAAKAALKLAPARLDSTQDAPQATPDPAKRASSNKRDVNSDDNSEEEKPQESPRITRKSRSGSVIQVAEAKQQQRIGDRLRKLTTQHLNDPPAL
jgi:hypothetical protein